jgi:TetR/AcrR family transcriptional repressor of nem operon
MQDLVDGLGISRSSLYDTYTDKHTLYMKALESYRKQGYAKIREIIDDATSAKETIKRLLEFTTDEMLGDSQQKGCFMVNAEVEVALHDQEVNDVVCKNDKQLEETFYQLIKKGKDNGEITNQMDARALAGFIFNTVKGIQVTAKATSDRAIFDNIIKIAVSVLDSQ